MAIKDIKDFIKSRAYAWMKKHRTLLKFLGYLAPIGWAFLIYFSLYIIDNSFTTYIQNEITTKFSWINLGLGSIGILVAMYLRKRNLIPHIFVTLIFGWAFGFVIGTCFALGLWNLVHKFYDDAGMLLFFGLIMYLGYLVVRRMFNKYSPLFSSP